MFVLRDVAFHSSNLIAFEEQRCHLRKREQFFGHDTRWDAPDSIYKPILKNKPRLFCVCNLVKSFCVSCSVALPILRTIGNAVLGRALAVAIMGLKKLLGSVFCLLVVYTARSEVRVSVLDVNGVAWLTYECTAGEVVRAFALDVSVDRGQIVGVSGFLRGESKAGATGYGIFPASFRDHIVVNSATNIDWNSADYTPLALVTDSPGDTLPGLNSSGVTLELGGLWNPNDAAAVPAARGLLCTLQLNQAANVSVAANISRGGIVGAFAGVAIEPVFIGGLVGPAITSATVQDGMMTVIYKGGELQTAPSVSGPWSDTGDSSGRYLDPVVTGQMKFYRVRSL
jgi:hypothetical protein